MNVTVFLTQNSPNYNPMIFSGKLSVKVIQRDHIKKDGTKPLYLQIFLNKQRKLIQLSVSVREVDFDKQKQRVKPKAVMAYDYNLIIEKSLGDINRIEVAYRLANQGLTLEKLTEEFENPSGRIDFVNFWKTELEAQKGMLKPGTYRQQKSALQKLKGFKSSILFYEVTPELLVKLKTYLKKLGNQDNTIGTFMKSFKKFLHLANEKGIITPLHYSKIESREFKSDRTFLTKAELQKLNEYFDSSFINEAHRKVLGGFLFSCFAGLRISDLKKLSWDNVLENHIIFTAEKTTKIQRIGLNKTARKFLPYAVDMVFSNEHMNRELKFITKVCGIDKRVTTHVARHTFATQFLMAGGRVEHLQKLLGHSKITETMIYAHIVESMTDTQIHYLDSVLNINGFEL